MDTEVADPPLWWGRANRGDMGRIVIAGDESPLAQQVQACLNTLGHHTSTLTAAQREQLPRDPLPDLVVVVSTDHAELLTWRQAVQSVGEIGLVAVSRRDEADEILALTCGADGVLDLPLSGSLVQARVDAVIRRVERCRKALSTYTFGGMSVDLGQRRVVVGDTVLSLTRIEFELLKLLVENRPRVMNRSELVTAVWGQWAGDDHVLEVHLSRLRSKVVRAGGPRLARAIPGFGYSLGLDEAPARL